MKISALLSILFLVNITSFAQETSIINTKDLPQNKGVSPKNIFVSGQDLIDLGLYFEEYDLVTEVTFGITDEVYTFSNTNKYLIKYNREKSEIKFGCLIPTNKENEYRFSQSIIITVEKQLDAMSAPITQGE